jgi:hypothetical protein
MCSATRRVAGRVAGTERDVASSTHARVTARLARAFREAVVDTEERAPETPLARVLRGRR